MQYQPETTHVNPSNKTHHEYAIINGGWRFWNGGGWFPTSYSVEWCQENLLRASKPEITEQMIQDMSRFESVDVSCVNPDKLSGGSCNYYMVKVERPTTLPEPYTIECNDLIEALGLSFKEANIIKEIFRTANERTHGNGKPGNSNKRAAEKVLFFAIRNAIDSGVDIAKFTSEINLK